MHGVTEVFVLWFDDLQRAAMDTTEPHYDLVSMSGSRYPLELLSGRRVPLYAMYRSRWGALRPSPDEAPLEAGDQRDVLVPAREVAEVPGVLARDRKLRDRARLEMAARGLAVPDGLEVLPLRMVPGGELAL
jgi:hypothetical protein